MNRRAAFRGGETSRVSAGVAEVIRRCAGYARAADDDALAVRLETLADAPADPATLAALDMMLAEHGVLHGASVEGGWEEEFLGLAGAYRVEAAVLRRAG